MATTAKAKTIKKEVKPRLDRHFSSQPLWDLAQKFEALESSIAFDFLEEFRKYKYQVLGLVAENMDVVEHPDVQKAIAQETTRVVKALSKENQAAKHWKITAEIFSAANNNIRIV